MPPITRTCIAVGRSRWDHGEGSATTARVYQTHMGWEVEDTTVWYNRDGETIDYSSVSKFYVTQAEALKAAGIDAANVMAGRLMAKIEQNAGRAA